MKNKFLILILVIFLPALLFMLKEANAFCVIQGYIFNATGDPTFGAAYARCGNETQGPTEPNSGYAFPFGGIFDNCNYCNGSIYVNASNVTLNIWGWNSSTGGNVDTIELNITMNLTLNDLTPPEYSNVQTEPSSNPIYGQTIYARADWTDADSDVDIVYCESNYTGTWANYTTTKEGNTYRYQFPTLAVGTYYWRQIANDTAGNWNTTMPLQTFTVQQATPTLTLDSSAGWNIMSGIATNITCSGPAQLTIRLYENNTEVSSGPGIAFKYWTPVAGTYNYVCNTTGNENYTSASINNILNVSLGCKNLDTPNEIYYLSGNVSASGTCFNVLANNVTIDCQGHTINYSISSVGHAINIEANNTTIRNCNIVGFNSSLIGAHAIHSYGSFSKIYNNNITTYGWSSFAIDLFGSSSNNEIYNNRINTTRSDSRGISFWDNINNNSIINNTITTGGYGILFYNSDSNIIKDTIINASAHDLYVQGAGTNNLTNVTFDKEDVGFDAGATGSINVFWYLDVYVKYSNGTAAAEANVSAWNAENVLAFTELTNASGYITRKTLREYRQNATSKYFDTNYTINATKNSYNDSKQVNLTHNRIIDTGTEIVLVFEIPDTTSPTYSNQGHNTTIAGTPVKFYIQYNDDIALHPNGIWIFSTNNTGTWINDTAINFTETPGWANVTKILNSTVGITIGYRWYVSDNAGNRNDTPIFTLTTTGDITPTITFVGPTPANNTIQNRNWIYVNVTSNEALDIAILEWQGSNYTMSGSGTNWFYNKTGLSDGSYSYKVYGNRSDTGVWGVSETRIVKIDITPPIITNVTAYPSSTSATISWITNENANSSVNYGTNITLGNFVHSAIFVTNHSIALTGLNANTLYYYNVTSCDLAGNCITEGPYNFTTLSRERKKAESEMNETTPAEQEEQPKEETKVEDITEKLTANEEVLYEMRVKDSILISIGKTEKHKIVLETIGDNFVEITIHSKPKKASIFVGETKEFDLNDDAINDIAIKLESIDKTDPSRPKAILKTILLARPKICECPECTSWSICSNGIQTRTCYECSAETNFSCKAYEETGECEIPKPKLPLRINLFLIIVAVVIIIIIYFLVQKRKTQDLEFYLAKKKEIAEKIKKEREKIEKREKVENVAEKAIIEEKRLLEEEEEIKEKMKNLEEEKKNIREKMLERMREIFEGS